MSVGIGFQEIAIIAGSIIGLIVLAAVIYAITKGNGKGPE